jgi:hypothetical protein
VAAQREQIKLLLRSKEASTKRYQESLKNYRGSDDDEDEPPRGLDNAESSTGIFRTSSIASSITVDRLASCVEHVKSLLEDIETLQNVLSGETEGKDYSDHHQSLINSYFRARSHLESVLLGNPPGSTSSLSGATLRNAPSQVSFEAGKQSVAKPVLRERKTRRRRQREEEELDYSEDLDLVVVSGRKPIPRIYRKSISSEDWSDESVEIDDSWRDARTKADRHAGRKSGDTQYKNTTFIDDLPAQVASWGLSYYLPTTAILTRFKEENGIAASDDSYVAWIWHLPKTDNIPVEEHGVHLLLDAQDQPVICFIELLQNGQKPRFAVTKGTVENTSLEGVKRLPWPPTARPNPNAIRRMIMPQAEPQGIVSPEPAGLPLGSRPANYHELHDSETSGVIIRKKSGELVRGPAPSHSILEFPSPPRPPGWSVEQTPDSEDEEARKEPIEAKLEPEELKKTREVEEKVAEAGQLPEAQTKLSKKEVRRRREVEALKTVAASRRKKTGTFELGLDDATLLGRRGKKQKPNSLSKDVSAGEYGEASAKLLDWKRELEELEKGRRAQEEEAEARRLREVQRVEEEKEAKRRLEAEAGARGAEKSKESEEEVEGTVMWTERLKNYLRMKRELEEVLDEERAKKEQPSASNPPVRSPVEDAEVHDYGEGTENTDADKVQDRPLRRKKLLKMLKLHSKFLHQRAFQSALTDEELEGIDEGVVLDEVMRMRIALKDIVAAEKNSESDLLEVKQIEELEEILRKDTRPPRIHESVVREREGRQAERERDRVVNQWDSKSERQRKLLWLLGPRRVEEEQKQKELKEAEDRRNKRPPSLSPHYTYAPPGVPPAAPAVSVDFELNEEGGYDPFYVITSRKKRVEEHESWKYKSRKHDREEEQREEKRLAAEEQRLKNEYESMHKQQQEQEEFLPWGSVIEERRAKEVDKLKLEEFRLPPKPATQIDELFVGEEQEVVDNKLVFSDSPPLSPSSEHGPLPPSALGGDEVDELLREWTTVLG